MSEHRFTVRVNVDDIALAEHNRVAKASGVGLPIPEQVSDWSGDELALAFESELAEWEVIDYDGEPGMARPSSSRKEPNG